ncbi:putative Embryo sac development arrest 6 [Quillaja saponaria]|uniref:Embryo sac development arrest 6 n=1 Tax=Quillaja saponaria TaxID=32244 RepID=A0AAD7LAS6_QUISA|nr:putative Embryo sac development arrest 6 [Quillaja saponaria]
MMSYHPRRILPPGVSKKRKETEALFSATARPSTPVPASLASTKASEPFSSNRLLAGYMAYEFLTKGTLFGEKFDPGRAEAVPLASSSSSLALSKRTKPEVTAEVVERSLRKEQDSYGEVASILKSDGAHIPGIVNPTQLTRWIQM